MKTSLLARVIRRMIQEATVFRRRPGKDGEVTVTRVEVPDRNQLSDLPHKADREQSLGLKQIQGRPLVSRGKAPSIGQLAVRTDHLEWGYGKLVDAYTKSGQSFGTIVWRDKPPGAVSAVSTDIPFSKLGKAADFFDPDDLEPMPGVNVISRTSKSQFYK